MSSNSDIPEGVERFLLTRIPSVPCLEAALLFHAMPTLARTAREIAQALYLPDHAALKILQALIDNGIVTAEGDHYCYAPGEQSHRMLDQVALAYKDNLIGVTQLIHNSTRKSAQRFADAFKLRKDV
ncbi:hypothetical protein [Ideonella sp.]|uniref:hypothetical protein n=1 Tax=Ideonella sp. TaxID=1929293 RepID=UPI0035B3B6CD